VLHSTGMALALHPDRLLPAEPGVRAIARELYGAVRELPVISPHGHVDPRVLLDDEPFGDPASLLVTPDHYVTRLLHASGVGLDELGVAQGPLLEEGARAVWRRMCAHWHVFRGTPMRLWLEAGLEDSGVEVVGCAAELGEALSMLELSFDAAVLDADLNGQSVAPVAEVLRREGRPFVFATGYADKAAPLDFDAPIVRKPYNVHQIAKALASVTGR